jgi:hypothetical protein
LEELALPSVGASFKKWGCCTPILPKAKLLGPFSKLPKIYFFKIKKFQKNWDNRIVWTCRAVPIFFEFFSSCPPLFAQVVNSFSLAATHAHPAQTSP